MSNPDWNAAILQGENPNPPKPRVQIIHIYFIWFYYTIPLFLVNRKGAALKSAFFYVKPAVLRKRDPSARRTPFSAFWDCLYDPVVKFAVGAAPLHQPQLIQLGKSIKKRFQLAVFRQSLEKRKVKILHTKSHRG